MTHQLFKRQLHTNEVTKAFPTWEPMTEREALTALSKMSQAPRPKYHYFVAPLTEWPALV